MKNAEQTKAAYHAHLEKCAQCRGNPFDQCPTGERLLTAAANACASTRHRRNGAAKAPALAVLALAVLPAVGCLGTLSDAKVAADLTKRARTAKASTGTPGGITIKVKGTENRISVTIESTTRSTAPAVPSGTETAPAAGATETPAEDPEATEEATEAGKGAE